MAAFLISGLLNMETVCRVRGFPINYYPVDYPFFGVATAASGVALNIAKALQRVTQFTPSDPVRVGDVEPRVDLTYGNLRPEPTVTIGNTTLVKDRDYSLSYNYTMSGGQIMEGPASCVVRGLPSSSGGGFTGSATMRE